MANEAYKLKGTKQPIVIRRHKIAFDSSHYFLAWVFVRLQSCRTAKSANIDRDALIFALGMATLEGRTQTEIANSYGITKAAFSARVKSWQKLLGLKPSSFMKSEQACKAYRNARLRNLTRKQ